MRGDHPDEIEMARQTDLLKRLHEIEHPPKVKLSETEQYEPIPLADPRFFAARRLKALDQIIGCLARLGRMDEALEVRKTRDRVRQTWESLTNGGRR